MVGTTLDKKAIKAKLKNLLERTSACNSNTVPTLVEHLYNFMEARIEKEVKYRLHQRSKAVAKYKNKARQTIEPVEPSKNPGTPIPMV